MRLKIEPRMLDKTTAAAYCGLTVATFASVCPVAPVRFGSAARYDRKALDHWLDSYEQGRPSIDEILDRLDK